MDWLQGEMEERFEVTGLLSRANKRLNDRLWNELERIGVTKQQAPETFVAVAGEFGLGLNVPWLSSAQLVGQRTGSGRIFGLSGRGSYARERWRGLPSVAFQLLEGIADRAGPHEFWTAFRIDSGHSIEDTEADDTLVVQFKKEG